MSNILNAEGLLSIVEWAEDEGFAGYEPYQGLAVYTGPRPSPMAHANATGEGLVSNGKLGADIIRLAAGDGFVPHTHPGDHLLIVIAGHGTMTYAGKIYPTKAGQAFMVEGAIAHAVGAITDHVLLSVGCPHKLIDATDRMTPVEYAAVASDIGELHCLICDTIAAYPERLHDLGCKHCPCDTCNPIREGAGH